MLKLAYEFFDKDSRHGERSSTSNAAWCFWSEYFASVVEYATHTPSVRVELQAGSVSPQIGVVPAGSHATAAVGSVETRADSLAFIGSRVSSTYLLSKSFAFFNDSPSIGRSSGSPPLPDPRAFFDDRFQTTLLPWYPQYEFISITSGLESVGTLVGESRPAAGESDGSSAASGNAAMLRHAAGEADGASTASAAARKILYGIGDADGVSATSGQAIRRVYATGESDGISTASGYALYKFHGTTAGLSTPSGTANANFEGFGESDGLSMVAGDGGLFMHGQCEADGASAASGFGIRVQYALGESDGASSIAAFGLYAFHGATSGLSTFSGTAHAKYSGVGESDGVSPVTGTAIAHFEDTGEAAGSSAIAGLGGYLLQGAFEADGFSDASAYSLYAFNGVLAGAAVVSADAWANYLGQALAAGIATVSVTGHYLVNASGELDGLSTFGGTAHYVFHAVAEVDGTSTFSGFARWAFNGRLTGANEAIAVGAILTYVHVSGKSACAGHPYVHYMVWSSTARSTCLVRGLGGYPIRVSGALIGACHAESIEGANLRVLSGEADNSSSLLMASETQDGQPVIKVLAVFDGDLTAAADVQGNACYFTHADGLAISSAWFNGIGTVSANLNWVAHATGAAHGSSRLIGSAPTSVYASGTLSGHNSAVEYAWVKFPDVQALYGLSRATAAPRVSAFVKATAASHSYMVSCHANYSGASGPGGTAASKSAAAAVATVISNELPRK